MTYVLDTNAVSALMRGEPVVCARLSSVPRGEVFVPQPVWAELHYGLARMSAGKRRERLRERLREIEAEIAEVRWTAEVSRRFGSIKAELERRGARLEDFDVAIAAHAAAADAVLVTHDHALSTRVPGIVVEDWSRHAEPPLR